jgi:ATP-dependent exoDNAse (exonuclease V) beta subunit
VACIKLSPEKIDEINKKISRSITFAIITLAEKQKEEARKLFDTPLVFTVQKAKGLEYENVILYHFIEGESRFLDIASGLTPDVLDQEFKYGRAKSKSDKTMEMYKFYINSLYVGITRAIKSVYLIEKNPDHPLIKLIDINEINQSINMDISESSIEEWQKEASRLAQQGKIEQAVAINEIILKQKTPPWTVVDKKAYLQLLDNVFTGKKQDKKEQFDLFEVAMLYNDRPTIEGLWEQGFRPAAHVHIPTQVDH